MKRIHLTESQIRYIKEELNELDVKVKNEKGDNPQDNLRQAEKEVRDVGINPNNSKVNYSIEADTLEENNKNFITKRQLKEAKLNYLKKNSKRFTKKTLSI